MTRLVGIIKAEGGYAKSTKPLGGAPQSGKAGALTAGKPAVT